MNRTRYFPASSPEHAAIGALHEADRARLDAEGVYIRPVAQIERRADGVSHHCIVVVAPTDNRRRIARVYMLRPRGYSRLSRAQRRAWAERAPVVSIKFSHDVRGLPGDLLCEPCPVEGRA